MEIHPKDKLIHIAAQIDQLAREVEAIWNDKSVGALDLHQAGILLGSLRTSAGLAGRL